jgi:hypothetical protein
MQDGSREARHPILANTGFFGYIGQVVTGTKPGLDGSRGEMTFGTRLPFRQRYWGRRRRKQLSDREGSLRSVGAVAQTHQLLDLSQQHAVDVNDITA